MTEAAIFDVLRQALWVAVLISAPLLLVALVAGVTIGLFQALTGVQEMTLTFVPKVGAMMAVFWVSMSFMTATLVTFFTGTVLPAITGAEMDAAGYVALARQSGLMREMQIVANNIANVSTTGFRREGLVFAEHVARMEEGPSLSIAHASGRLVDLTQAGLVPTGGTWDLGIQGPGFFLVETPDGDRLTRAGAFTPNAEGELVTPDGHRLLDAGGAPVFVPPGAAVSVGADGTVSADGVAVGQIGLWQPADPMALRHTSGTLFDGGAVEPAEGGTIRQGFLEESNVNPVSEIARMIEVQRAYEMGQKFLETEDTRARTVIQTLGR